MGHLWAVAARALNAPREAPHNPGNACRESGAAAAAGFPGGATGRVS